MTGIKKGVVMAVKIQGSKPLFPEVLPQDPTQEKFKKWLIRVSEALFSSPMGTHISYQKNFYREIAPSSFEIKIHSVAVIVLALLTIKKPYVGTFLLLTGLAVKIGHRISTQSIAFKKYPLQERLVSLQGTEGDYVEVNDYGFALHFGAFNYGTHPQAKEEAHDLFKELSQPLLRTLSEGLEKRSI
jgi:hypothetical protein